ncbi:MAG: response regulator [Thermoplasmatota archaeon]
MLNTFLLVDDAPVIRMAIQRMLVKAGISATQIEQAGDGEEAIKIFDEINADVVFMDMEMPGMDGETASTEIMMRNPEVKVIIITGLARDDPRVKNIISMGAFDVVQKPVHEAEIRRILTMIQQDDPAFGTIL